eukprot:scaffold13222_cov122-Isochrysis_galbana.AAC.3
MTAMRARGCERDDASFFAYKKLADLSATHGHRQAKHVLPQLNVLEQQRAARQVVRSSFRLPRRAYGPTSISRSNQPVQQHVCDERHHGPPWRSLELNDGDNDEVAMAGRRAATMAGGPLDNLFRDRYGVIALGWTPTDRATRTCSTNATLQYICGEKKTYFGLAWSSCPLTRAPLLRPLRRTTSSWISPRRRNVRVTQRRTTR